MDCSHISKFNNVCLMFCTTRPVAAVDGSTFCPSEPREDCSPIERHFFETTAFTYEFCQAITDMHNPVEVTAIAKRLRQRLVQNTLEDADPVDGYLPWCNSNCVEDFYFVALPPQDVKARKNHQRKKKRPLKKIRTPPPPPPRVQSSGTAKSPRRPAHPRKSNSGGRVHLQSPHHPAAVTSQLGTYEMTRESEFEGMVGTSKR